mgnify:CR=1 FL=1
MFCDHGDNYFSTDLPTLGTELLLRHQSVSGNGDVVMTSSTVVATILARGGVLAGSSVRVRLQTRRT